jgi:RNA polymerase sigma-70 factor (ECF subfamily)
MNHHPAEIVIDAEDRQLIHDARGGDERAFNNLVNKYKDLVFKFAFKVCRNEEKAEEIFQDTFVNVYRKLNQFDGRSKFSTWLYSIITNNCLMHNRKGKLEQATIRIDELSGYDADGGEGERKSPLPPMKTTPLDTLMHSELKQTLDDAILKLPPAYRLVFVLCDIEGQSAMETAKVLKISVPAVKSRLRRGRIFLRNQLQPYVNG